MSDIDKVIIALQNTLEGKKDIEIFTEFLWNLKTLKAYNDEEMKLLFDV
jgi:hypothetical protein